MEQLDKRNAMIRCLYQEGIKMREIAAEFEMTERNVHYIIAGKNVRGSGRPRLPHQPFKDEILKVECYCPTCGRDKPYTIEIKDGDVVWSGRGLWPRYCKKHERLRRRVVLPTIYDGFDSTERDVISSLDDIFGFSGANERG